MGDAPHRFILQAIDPDHGCPALEAAFRISDFTELHALLREFGDADPELQGSYELDAAEWIAICDRFGIAFDPGGREVRLERFRSLRNAPYLIHTGYELALLLDGAKQFARMGEEYPPDRHHDEDRFDRYVAKGLLHKEVAIQPFATPLKSRNGSVVEGLRDVYYTRKGEEWRIPAWKLISAAARKCGWNDEFERLEGMLYGYEEWQMDWWMAYRRELQQRNI